jgi:hypothetical protein
MRECSICHKPAETRPYGPGGARICYDCMIADPELHASARVAMGDAIERAAQHTGVVQLTADGFVPMIVPGRGARAMQGGDHEHAK